MGQLSAVLIILLKIKTFLFCIQKKKKEKLNLERKFLKPSKVPAPSRLKPVSSGKSSVGSTSTVKPSTAAIKGRFLTSTLS